MESAISPYVLKEDGTSSGNRVLIDLTESDLEDFAMSPILEEDEDDIAAEVQQTAPNVPVPSFMMLNRDVRYMIYKLLLKSDTATVKPECIVSKTGNIKHGLIRLTAWFSENTEISAAICRTSRVIAAESLPVLYGINAFEFGHTLTEYDDFAERIGLNRLLVNRLQIGMKSFHFHDGGCSEDDIFNKVHQLGRYGSLTARLPRWLPNIKHLSVFWRLRPTCPAFLTALTAPDSDFVAELLKMKLPSLVTLEIADFPPELAQYILEFLQSEKKYVPPSADPKVESPPLLPVKPTRPLPPHACLSCQNCKCVHGVKPAQLLELQESLKLVQTHFSSGVGNPDQTTKKLLEQLELLNSRFASS